MISTRYVLQAKDKSFYKSAQRSFGATFDEAHLFSTELAAEKQKQKLDTYYAETTYTIQPVKVTL